MKELFGIVRSTLWRVVESALEDEPDGHAYIGFA